MSPLRERYARKNKSRLDLAVVLAKSFDEKKLVAHTGHSSQLFADANNRNAQFLATIDRSTHKTTTLAAKVIQLAWGMTTGALTESSE